MVPTFLYDSDGLPLLTEAGEELVVPWTGSMPTEGERVLLRGVPELDSQTFTVVWAGRVIEKTWMNKPTRDPRNLVVLKQCGQKEGE